LIVALVVVVTAGGWLIWIQQRAMKRFEITAKAIENQLKAADAIRQESRAAIETQIKGADTIREESRKAQETAHKDLMDRFTVVQSELQRLQSKQESLKESVKNAISVGLKDIQERLTSFKLSEIVTDQFKTSQWLSNQNQPLLWLVKGLR
jgi:chromosome segregation ATPase